ncbi:MAG: DUF3575 domain-containing protein [Bacteroidales bacterium]|jgi:hypothetical protein|nr:DUF3575 domain-containing protein [Bacteroidales bacterium]
MKSWIIRFFLFLVPVANFASKNDSAVPVLQPIHKNIIKFNPTPILLWSTRNLTFSYERILSPRQSVSVEVGYLELPRLFNDTIAHLVNITSRQKYGLNISLEYRFYLTQLNRRPIPAGLYIGPYLTFYGYKFKNGLDILYTSADKDGMFQGNFWAFNLGFELGYQFVFWKRITLDFVMVGPSACYYGGSIAISGTLDPGQIETIHKTLYDELKKQFPVIQYISINKSFSQSGKLDILRFGFRYLVQIGFHF